MELNRTAAAADVARHDVNRLWPTSAFDGADMQAKARPMPATIRPGLSTFRRCGTIMDEQSSRGGAPHMVDIQRVDENTLIVPRQGRMLTEATVFARQEIRLEEEALEQLCDAASIDSRARVMATPDIHRGYGVPIGCVWASRKFISAAAVGYDINCGMRLLTTPLALLAIGLFGLLGFARKNRSS